MPTCSVLMFVPIPSSPIYMLLIIFTSRFGFPKWKHSINLLCIFNLGTRLKWHSQLHTVSVTSPGKQTQYSMGIFICKCGDNKWSSLPENSASFVQHLSSQKQGQLRRFSDGLDSRGSIPGKEQGIFLFFTASRPALESTQPPIQWVSGILASEVKPSERKVDLSSQSSAEVKNGGAIPPLIIPLHVTVLN
jgi:hypothetical protein